MAVEPQTPATTLHLGERTIVIEATPLAKSRRTRLGIITDQPRASRLHLKQPIPRWARWLLAFLLLLVTTPIFLVVVLVISICLKEGAMARTDGFILGLISLPVLASFAVIPLLFLLGCRPPVDFGRQRVRMGVFGTCPSWMAQAHILAVQLLPGRVDEDLRGPGPSLQLNLLLDHPTLPRVGFITYRDAEWTREAGRKLAEYLSVPLVDQLPLAE